MGQCKTAMVARDQAKAAYAQAVAKANVAGQAFASQCESPPVAANCGALTSIK
jgi:hypothetical protein